MRQETILEKERIIITQNKEIQQLKSDIRNIEENLSKKHDEVIKVIYEKFAQEKSELKKTMECYVINAKKEEKLLSCAIHEMGCILNSVLANKAIGVLEEQHKKLINKSPIIAKAQEYAQST